MSEWVGEGFDPEEFSIQAINRNLEGQRSLAVQARCEAGSS